MLGYDAIFDARLRNGWESPVNSFVHECTSSKSCIYDRIWGWFLWVSLHTNLGCWFGPYRRRALRPQLLQLWYWSPRRVFHEYPSLVLSKSQQMNNIPNRQNKSCRSTPDNNIVKTLGYKVRSVGTDRHLGSGKLVNRDSVDKSRRDIYPPQRRFSCL